MATDMSNFSTPRPCQVEILEMILEICREVLVASTGLVSTQR